MTLAPMLAPPALRHWLLGLCAALVLLAAAPASAAAFASVERGDSGSRVATVQRVLGLQVDRQFGSGTARAVKRFQRRKRLAADGVVGGATWRALMRVARTQRARRNRGSSDTGRSRGAYVRLLQRRLGVTADGAFGPGTARALKRFQRRRGLTADGIAGPATWRALGRPGIDVVLKQRGGSRRSDSLPVCVRRVIAAANRIARKPYRYGGGHAKLQDSSYDCSGSMSYALRRAGLLDGSLNSTGFTRYGSPGRGYPGAGSRSTAPPGTPTWSSTGAATTPPGLRDTGSRWQPDRRSSAGFTVRHPPGL